MNVDSTKELFNSLERDMRMNRVSFVFRGMEFVVEPYSDGSVEIFVRADSGGNLVVFPTQIQTRSSYGMCFQRRES